MAGRVEKDGVRQSQEGVYCCLRVCEIGLRVCQWTIGAWLQPGLEGWVRTSFWKPAHHQGAKREG